MKNSQMATLLWVLALVFGLSWCGATLAIAQERDSSVSTAQPQQQPDAMDQQQTSTMGQLPGTKTFSGKIMKSGDKLVLQDSVGDSTYQLDDQQKAKAFQGKNVKVTGTVDSVTDTIHIAEIQPEP